MDLIFQTDERGRYLCTLRDGPREAIVTASNVPEAREALVDAVRSAVEEGYGECLWDEQGGDYRWMFRRTGDRMALVVLWTSGTLTGWQHVFRSECEAKWLADHVKSEMALL